MKKATYEEYVAAKAEVMNGGSCKEYNDTDEYGRVHKTICCEDGSNFYEVTENGITEFWSTKHAESRKYIEGVNGSECSESRQKAINRLYKLVYWFADEMLKEEAEGERNRAEFEKKRAEKPGEMIIMVDCSENNVRCMKNCMKASVEALNYLKNKDNEAEEWQITAINAMFDQCNKENIVPFDLPYSIKGLLLQWED